MRGTGGLSSLHTQYYSVMVITYNVEIIVSKIIVCNLQAFALEGGELLLCMAGSPPPAINYNLNKNL